MEHGGHFAALEEPQALVSDIRAFASSLPPSTFLLPATSPAPTNAAREEL